MSTGVVAKTGGAQRRLSVASVCRLLPTPRDASAGTFILNRLAAMQELVDLTVIQPIPFFPGLRPQPDWSRAPSRCAASLEIRHAPMFYMPGVLKTFDGRWLARSIHAELSQLKRVGRLDAIDAHFGYPEGVGCARVARQLGVPYFITLRGLETDVLERPGVSEQLLDALRSAAGLISVSHSLKDLVVARGIDLNAVLVAPNAVNRSIFSPGDRAGARRELGIADDVDLIVSVGHLLSVKRHNVLIDAVAQLHQRRRMKLVIVGGTSYEPRYPQLLKDQVERLGLGDVVTFVGKLPPATVATWLRAASVFSLASAREGCCNAVLEALACGAPVVATRVGDNPHFVKEDVDGFLAPPDDARALADALHRGLGREWNARNISSRLSVGTWHDTATRVVTFMESTLDATLRSAA